MKTSIAVLAMVALLIGLAGCMAAMETTTGSYQINGVTHQAAFIEGRGHYAGTIQTINTYDSTGKLETNNSFGSGGPLTAFVNGGLAGAEMGAGIGAGLAAQGAAKVVQNAKGASATTGAATGGTATATGGAGGAGGSANPVNINF